MAPPFRDCGLQLSRVCALALPAASALAMALAAAVGAQPVERRDVRVCAGGDVTLGTNLDTNWAVGRWVGSERVAALPDPVALLRPLRPLVGDADVVLINVEGAIGDAPAPRKCRPGSTLCYAMRQPPGTEVALRGLNDSAVIVGNVANNHSHDAGAAGFAETLRRLRDAGVLATGADTMATAVPVGGGDTIAVLGFSPWSIAAVTDLEAVRRHVKRAASRYGRVVVTMHIGAEGALARHTGDGVERFAGENRGNSVAFSRAAVESGASLVVGHGPHVLRAMEWNGQALVAHSLGNLVTYGPFNHSGYNDHGAVLCATLARDGAVRDASLRATHQRTPGIVGPDPDRSGVADIAELSAQDFPATGVRVAPSGEVLPRTP